LVSPLANQCIRLAHSALLGNPDSLRSGCAPNGWFWFRGGATLIIDPRLEKSEIRYVLTKNIASQERLERQRRTVSGNSLSPLRALYFGDAPGEPFAMMHAKNVGDVNA